MKRVLIFFFISSFVLSQVKLNEKEISIQIGHKDSLYGSLISVNGANTLAIIVQGSGPTDRNGNNPMMKNNSLKLLANELAANNISSFRFDKRGVAKSAKAALREDDLRFETYVNDLRDIIKNMRSKYSFKKVVLIGHSEGSLISILAALNSKVDLLISIAGAGRPIYDVIKEQLSARMPALLKDANTIIDSLKAGKTVDNVNPMLAALFRKSVQPYLISWFKYDPKQEISKLKIPVLVLQGDTDLQTSIKDAELLGEGASVKPIIISGMNHIFKNAPLDPQKNFATYNNPDLPINKEFAKAIIDFINN